ncbi:MAG: (2Fe-2S)-binding protein [Clostridia bacterium]|nr:(2Fe-2S)-binding protein [Clostridia bacterium]
MSGTLQISLKINGESRVLHTAAHSSLLNLLRDNGYFDVKCGCEQGDCGACTVLLDGIAVKSCVILAMNCDGHEVRTIKGLGGHDRLTSRLQKAFVEHGAIQCGFCTPGMIIAAGDYLRHDGRADREQIRRAMSGNLCRCTGYQKIIDAVYEVAAELESEVCG